MEKGWLRRRSKFTAFAVALALAAIAVAVFAVRGTAVETSVYAMLGENASVIPDDVRDESARTVFVVFSSPSSSVSRVAAERFRGRFQRDARRYLANDIDGGLASRLSKRADGLVADADLAALSSPEGRSKIALAAVRRYAASPIPPMFPPEDDPFCLKERFLSSFSDSPDVVVPISISAETANDTSRLEDFKRLLDEAVAAVRREADPSVRIMPCGVPLHTAYAVARCRRETGWLSLFSSVFILAVALAAFRPLSRVAYPAANLLASASAGAAALFIFTPSFHVTTILFGTSVLGLVADYSFHWLLRSPGSRRATVKSLAVSFATTALSLLPLAFSSLPVLRESSVFLSAALATAFVFVMLTHPEPLPMQHPDQACRAAIPHRRLPVVLLLALACAAAAFAIPRMEVKTSPSALYVPPKELLEPEKILASKWNPPSVEVAENIRRLYEEQGANVASALGLAAAPKAPEASGLGAADALADALDHLTDETKRRLLISLLAMLAALAVIYRSGVLAAAAPSAFALLAAAGFVTASGEAINLFHLLAGFLLAGMCVDYAVFMRSGEGGAMKSVTCSLLTSMAGFGALAFVSFPPAAAFGKVIGVGLPAGYLAAVALRKQSCGCDAPGGGGVEKAASPLGMEIIWACYRVLGLGAMRTMARCVANCAWAFSPAVRKASPSRLRLSMFARSLADKVAIVSGLGAMPKVRGDGSEDVRRFADDVSSGRGVFVLSSHCGTVEALLALAKDPPVFHAWTDMARTSVFNAFYLRHARGGKVALHSIADIGMDTAFAAINWLDRGECLVMAGDRGRGAFRFAAALGHPVYFATCIAEGPGYVAVVRRLDGGAMEMESRFSEILSALKAQHPEQNYEWNMKQ